jgi:integrase
MALKHRKLGQYRDIPVPGYVWAMVKDLPDGYLFRRGGVFSRYNAFLDTFKRRARKAGTPKGFTPHSLRHAFVSTLCRVASRLQTWHSGSATRTSTSHMPFTGTWCRTLRTGP